MGVTENTDRQEAIINKLHGDKVIWIIVFLLSLISIALIYSASSSLAFKDGGTNFAYMIAQCKFVIMGLVVLYICSKIPLGVYRAFTLPIFIISIILLGLTLTPLGKEINGAKRWIELGPLSFQPAELVKITIILYLARALEMWKLDTFKEFFIKIIMPIGVVCVLNMIGSVSTTIIVGGLSFIVLFIAGVKWSYLGKAVGIGIASLIVIILINISINKIFDVDLFPRFSTATSRIEKYFVKEDINKEDSAEEKQKKADETFQADMAKIAISSVGVLGKGPGNSTQRYVLPHSYSDFIYTTIIEEYGLLGGVFVLMLYLWLLYRCVMLVKNCSKTFTAITVGGLGLMITIQAGLHILVNTGILPVTGHTLPLVSRGGTSFIIFSAAFGIILSVSRTIDTDSAKREELERERIEKEAKEQEEKKKIAQEQQTKELESAAEENKTSDNKTEEAKQKKRHGYRGSEEIVLHEIIDKKTGEFK